LIPDINDSFKFKFIRINTLVIQISNTTFPLTIIHINLDIITYKIIKPIPFKK